MATRRRSLHVPASRLNFRPSISDIKFEVRGTKPTPKQHSVKEIFMLMVLHACKKSLFFDTNLKVGIYLGALFLISLIADIVTIPRSYLSRSDNALNLYFVKYAWGWNLILLLPYVLLTAYIYCCGQIGRIFKNHFFRLVVATFFWWFWTTLFNFVEASYGKCNTKGDQFNTKQGCLKAGNIWNGFDVSGHSFILIYGSLMLIEETRSMINWDSIKEHIRLEEHYRFTKDQSYSTNPLKNLTEIQFQNLKYSYEKYTPCVRGLFITITIYQLLWDIMLVCTMLYYHIMIEKFLGGAAAVLTWYLTYRFWFASSSILPKLPGEGVFRYMKPKIIATQVQHVRKRSVAGSVVNGAATTFMGRKLYTSNPETQDEIPR